MIQSFFAEIARRIPTSEFYVALPFWGYFAMALLLYRFMPVRPLLKDWLLLLCSSCMLLTLPRFSVTMLGTLIAVCLVTYACARSVLRIAADRSGIRQAVTAAGVLANILVLAFFKYSFVQGLILRRASGGGPQGADIIFLIGISYSSFKAMHFLIEAYKDTVKDLRLLDFLNYILFFPAFVSGPINRYNDFHENRTRASTSRLVDDASPGLQRIIHGLFKKFVLTVILFPYTLTNMGVPLSELTFWQIALGLYAFALYFYFDFSGYTDIAIGTARLLGFTLPENFNLPFFKKNIQQLWANWHMSLTSWLTDYIYWPLVRKMRSSEWLRKHPLLISNMAIVITFLVCGIWHGESFSFVLWGLYHGLGIATVNMYQRWKRNMRHKLVVKYFASRLSYCAGVLVTFNFFAFGLLLFVLNSQQLMILFNRLK